MAAPLIALLGPIASGKSTIAQAIVDRHPWRHVSIDRVRDAGGNWPDLIDQVETATSPLVVESVALLADYRAVLDARHALIVCVTCKEPTRAARLRARGERYRRPKYDDRRNAHVVVHGDRNNGAELIDRLVVAATERSRT